MFTVQHPVKHNYNTMFHVLGCDWVVNRPDALLSVTAYSATYNRLLVHFRLDMGSQWQKFYIAIGYQTSSIAINRNRNCVNDRILLNKPHLPFNVHRKSVKSVKKSVKRSPKPFIWAGEAGPTKHRIDHIGHILYRVHFSYTYFNIQQ